MAHWANLDENNIVTQVIVVADDKDEAWVSNLLGGIWKKTSYNTKHNKHALGGEPYRKNYASIGYTYNLELDAFIPPKPYLSWILNTEIGDWVAPIPYPTDEYEYFWNEEQITWQKLED